MSLYHPNPAPPIEAVPLSGVVLLESPTVTVAAVIVSVL